MIINLDPASLADSSLVVLTCACMGYARVCLYARVYMHV